MVSATSALLKREKLGSTGIGQGIAVLFAKQGAHVEVFDLKRALSKRTGTGMPGPAQVAKLKLRDFL